MPRRNRNAGGIAKQRRGKNKGRQDGHAPLSGNLHAHPRKRPARPK